MMIAASYLSPGRARASRAASGASPDASRIAESDGEACALPDISASSGAIRYARHRLPHFERPWAKYAIAFSTHNRAPLSPLERDLVMQSAVYGHEKNQCELYVVCVMPDHVHLLFEPQVRGQGEQGGALFWSLSDILRGIRSSSAHRINKLRESRGRVWQEDYFDRYVRSESDLHEKFHYICRNPWGSGVVKSNENYRWLWTPDRATNETVIPGRAHVSRAASGASPGARGV